MDAKEWTPARLAKESKMSRTYVVQILEGTSSTTGQPPKITVDKLLQLSTALRVHPMKLILAYQGKDPDSLEKESPLAEDEALLEAFRDFLRTRKKP